MACRQLCWGQRRAATPQPPHGPRHPGKGSALGGRAGGDPAQSRAHLHLLLVLVLLHLIKVVHRLPARPPEAAIHSPVVVLLLLHLAAAASELRLCCVRTKGLPRLNLLLLLCSRALPRCALNARARRGRLAVAGPARQHRLCRLPLLALVLTAARRLRRRVPLTPAAAPAAAAAPLAARAERGAQAAAHRVDLPLAGQEHEDAAGGQLAVDPGHLAVRGSQVIVQLGPAAEVDGHRELARRHGQHRRRRREQPVGGGAQAGGRVARFSKQSSKALMK
jgi:hypothetical protein